MDQIKDYKIDICC